MRIMEKNNVYFIGGSPCCGKSTIAEMICKQYGYQYYKADNHLLDYVKIGSEQGDEWLKYVSEMSPDQLWLREPEILNKEEITTYERLFAYFIEDINKFDNNIPVIAEGAAFLPHLIKKIGIDKSHYICIIPTKEFQINQYSKREWVNDYLSNCSDKEKAFHNWQERDTLFAKSAYNSTKELGYTTLTVDGNRTIDENYRYVLNVFGII